MSLHVKPEEIARRTPLSVAERLLADALETLRMLTPEGWDQAYFAAMNNGWHSVDVARLKEARLMSMRSGGVRFKP